MFFYEFFSVIICSHFADRTVAACNLDQTLAEGDRLLHLDVFDSSSTLQRRFPWTTCPHMPREMRWPHDANTMQIYTNDPLIWAETKQMACLPGRMLSLYIQLMRILPAFHLQFVILV